MLGGLPRGTLLGKLGEAGVIEYPGPCQLLLVLVPGCTLCCPTCVSRAGDCWPGGRKAGCGPPCCWFGCCCSKGDAAAPLLLAGTATGSCAGKLSGSEGRRHAAALTPASLLLLAVLRKVSPALFLSLPLAYIANCRGDQNLMLDALAVTMVLPCGTHAQWSGQAKATITGAGAQLPLERK